ncbi:hypothetical protein FOPE_00898 [Fonsecaea pedrosoi]|nr:hypothetical protein FOPE_00898 [Fonsecaea pedrosoi]
MTCTHCDKAGHTENKCWTLHPELMPKALKEKIKVKNIKTEPVAGLASSDVDLFRNTLFEAEGTLRHPNGRAVQADPPHQAPTNEH